MKIFEPKIISSLKTYSKKQIISDIVAGIIVAIIALPLSIALAIASGVSPEQGLYTAIIAGFVIALFGGSKVNITLPKHQLELLQKVAEVNQNIILLLKDTVPLPTSSDSVALIKL